MASHHDRVALVTGGSRGIGFEIARTLMAEGASVVVTGREPAGLAAATRAANLPERFMALNVDSGDLEDGGAAAVRSVMERFGRIDYLVNNAALALRTPMMNVTAAEALRTLSLNTVAPLLHAQEAWRAFMQENGGSIVNIASIAAYRRATAVPWYAVSKAALVRTTEVLAAELGPHVRVNCVAPATTRTDLGDQFLTGDAERAKSEGYPMKRVGRPADIAHVVSFLLSDEASFVTGETVLVDGGAMMGRSFP